MVGRKHLLPLFCAGIAGSFWICRSQTPVEKEDDFDRFATAGTMVRELSERFGLLFQGANSKTLGEAAHQLIAMGWDLKRVDAEHDEIARSMCQTALARILPILDSARETERLGVNRGEVLRQTLRRRWPSGKGVLVLRIADADAGADTTPEFL